MSSRVFAWNLEAGECKEHVVIRDFMRIIRS